MYTHVNQKQRSLIILGRFQDTLELIEITRASLKKSDPKQWEGFFRKKSRKEVLEERYERAERLLNAA